MLKQLYPVTHKRLVLALAVPIAFVFGALVFSLIGCGRAATQDNAVIFESSLEVHWSNGYQTSHYMFGPLPGEGAQFSPTDNWYYALRGATAQSVPFAFNFPTVPADHVMWRTVWIPQHTEARLVISTTASIEPPVVYETTVVAQFTPADNGGAISQKTEHPLANPRAVDVDITEAFNAAVAKGQFTFITWQVRRWVP